MDTRANSINSQSATTTAIDEFNAVTLNSVVSTNGSIRVASGNTLTVDLVQSTTDAQANGVSLTTAAGNVDIDEVKIGTSADATAGDVLVNAAGSITDLNAGLDVFALNSAAVNITGDNVNLTARGGLIDVDTRVNSINSQSATSTRIDEFNAVTLNSVVATDGPVTVNAGGAVRAVLVQSLADRDVNDIAITTSAGDMTVETITAGPVTTGTTAGDVTLRAATASILDDGNDATRITGDVVTLTAANNIGVDSGAGDLDLTANRLTVDSTVAGTVFLDETDSVFVDRIVTVDGLVSLVAGGTTTVVSEITAGGTGRDITVRTTAGDIELTGTTTAAGDVVTLNAAGKINGSGLVTGRVIDLDAVAGIGDVRPVELAGSNLTIDSVNGRVDVDNTLATPVVVDTLTTGTGDIEFDQTGGGSVTFNTVRTTDGNIRLTSDVGNVTNAGSITAGGDGRDVTVVTTGGANVELTGTTTAAGDRVTINANGAINGAGLVTANVIDLDAVTGIGNLRPLELTGTTLMLDSVNGDVDADNVLGTAVQVNTLTTGTGDIRFDQAGGGSVTFNIVRTVDGNVRLTSDSGDLINAATIIAGGANRSVTLLTTTRGNIELTGVTTAANDLVTMTSVDKINGSGLVTARVIDLNADKGIGDDRAVELAGQELTIDTRVGDVDVDNVSSATVVLGTLTTTSGNILFDQSGGAATTYQVVRTGLGNIGITQTGGGAASFESVVTDAGSITVDHSGAGDVALVQMLAKGLADGLLGRIDVTVANGNVFIGGLTSDRTATQAELDDLRLTERSVDVVAQAGSVNELNGDGMTITTTLRDRKADVSPNTGATAGDGVVTTVLKQLKANLDYGFKLGEVPSAIQTLVGGDGVLYIGEYPIVASTRGQPYTWMLRIGEAGEQNWQVYFDWNQSDLPEGSEAELKSAAGGPERLELLQAFYGLRSSLTAYPSPAAAVPEVSRLLMGSPAGQPSSTFGYTYQGANDGHPSSFFVTMLVRVDDSIRVTAGGQADSHRFTAITLEIKTVITDKDIIVRASALPQALPLQPAGFSRTNDSVTAPVATQNTGAFVETRDARVDQYVFRVVSPDPAEESKELAPEDRGILKGQNFKKRLAELPDGRYQLILKRRDGTDLPLLEFILRDGKPVNPLDAELERLRRLEESGELESGKVTDDQSAVTPADADGDVVAGVDGTAIAVEVGSHTLEGGLDDGRGVEATPWRAQVVETLRTSTEGSFSKAGRLYKRLAAGWGA